MMTKEYRSEIRRELCPEGVNTWNLQETRLIACLDDLDEKDQLISNCGPTVKLGVFSDQETIIIVGLDKEGNPIDKDGTLFGPASGRNLDEFNETPFSPSKGEVVIVDSRLSKRVI